MFNKQKEKRSDLFLWRVCSRAFATKRSLGQTKGRFGILRANQLSSPKIVFFASSFGTFVCSLVRSLFNCGTKPIKINWIYCIRWKCYVIWRPRRTRNTNNGKMVRHTNASWICEREEKESQIQCKDCLVPAVAVVEQPIQTGHMWCRMHVFFVAACRLLGLVRHWFGLILLAHWKVPFAGASQSSVSLFVTRIDAFLMLNSSSLFRKLLYRQLILWTIYSSIRRNKRFARKP